VKNILVLGANGFIGRYLSRALAQEKGLSLTLFSKTIDHIRDLGNLPNVKVVKGDYTDVLGLVPIIKNADIVYHLISASVPSTSWARPTLEIHKNLLPTIHLLQLCSDLDVKKVVYLSSGGTVYGEQKGHLDESTALKPFSPYGITKVTIEYFLEYFRRKAGLNYEIYRLSNPYGIGLDKLGFGVINTWLNAAAKGEPIYLFGSGKIRKDFIYIEDAIRLLMLSLRNPLGGSHIYNISRGEAVTLNRLLSIIDSVTTIPLNIIHKTGNKSDNKLVQLDNRKILKYFPGFQFTSLEQGINQIWQVLVK
jgi:UDP-glucose 4-epimerase